jgi:hypothetical protein
VAVNELNLVFPRIEQWITVRMTYRPTFIITQPALHFGMHRLAITASHHREFHSNVLVGRDLKMFNLGVL